MNFLTSIRLRTNDPKEASKIVLETLKEYKVVKIIPEWHLSDLRYFYDNLVDLIGNPINIGEDFKKGGAQTNEKWLEIRYDADVPDLAAYRHSKNAQPLHTDESYISDPADVMLFYCVNKAEEGGATTFIDGPVLINYMKENFPDLLDRLLNTTVKFRKAEETRESKIIYEKNGQIHFNYNYYCIDPDESEENKTLNKDFFEFLQNYIAYSYMTKQVFLNPGEGVLWWDELVLHGRTSFAAQKTNDRFIWKTGFKWKS